MRNKKDFYIILTSYNSMPNEIVIFGFMWQILHGGNKIGVSFQINQSNSFHETSFHQSELKK